MVLRTATKDENVPLPRTSATVGARIRRADDIQQNKPVPFTSVQFKRCLPGATHRGESDGHHPVRVSAGRGAEARLQFRAGGQGAARGDARRQEAAGDPFDDTGMYKMIEGAS